MKTRLGLTFRLWGVAVDPASVTATTGVAPRRAFKVGEARGTAARKVASWEWESRSADDWDIEPLMNEFVSVLGPHADVVRAAVDAGAIAKLTVVGAVLGDVVATEAEADVKNYYVGESFRPFVHADRVELYLDNAALRVLADMGASFNTHIDFDLDNYEWDEDR